MQLRSRAIIPTPQVKFLTERMSSDIPDLFSNCPTAPKSDWFRSIQYPPAGPKALPVASARE